MKRRNKLIAGAAIAGAVLAGASGIAVATSGQESDAPLSETTLERAAAAALAHTGGGTVVESEIGDDGAAYGIEVRLADGRVVEVSLDASFNVISSVGDDDGANDQDGPNDNWGR